MSVINKLTPDFTSMSRVAKQSWITETIASHASAKCLLVFSKSYWPYATKGKDALNSVGVNYSLVELDECGEQRNGDVQTILKSINGRGTVPNIFIPTDQTFDFGGGDGTQKLQRDGELVGILKNAGCSFGQWNSIYNLYKDLE